MPGRYPNLVVVSIDVDAENPGSLIGHILNVVKKKFPTRYHAFPGCMEKDISILDKTSELEKALARVNLRLLILIDEFQFVYKAGDKLGSEMITEVAKLSNTDYGVTHDCVW